MLWRENALGCCISQGRECWHHLTVRSLFIECVIGPEKQWGEGQWRGATHPEALLLLHGGVDADGGEVALREQLVQLLRPQHALHEDHDLRQQSNGEYVVCRDEWRTWGEVCEGDRLHISSSNDDKRAAAEVFMISYNLALPPLLSHTQTLVALHDLAAPRELPGRLTQMAACSSHEPVPSGHY